MLRLLLLCLCILLHSMQSKDVDTYYKELNNLTQEQRKILSYTVQQGKSEGVGYVLAAIAWKESKLGTWILNLDDGKYGSFSIYHINLEYYLKKKKISNTSWNRSRQAEILLENTDIATDYVIEMLNYWKKHHKVNKHDHEKVLMSYNGGYAKSKQAESYGKDVMIRIEALEKYYKSRVTLSLN